MERVSKHETLVKSFTWHLFLIIVLPIKYFKYFRKHFIALLCLLKGCHIVLIKIERFFLLKLVHSHAIFKTISFMSKAGSTVGGRK